MEKLREGREGERERERERDGEGEGEGMVVEVLGVVQLGELCSSSSSFSSSSSSSCFFSSSSSSFCSSSFSLPSSLLGKNLVMVVELMEEGCLYDFLDSGRRVCLFLFSFFFFSFSFFFVFKYLLSFPLEILISHFFLENNSTIGFITLSFSRQSCPVCILSFYNLPLSFLVLLLLFSFFFHLLILISLN